MKFRPPKPVSSPKPKTPNKNPNHEYIILHSKKRIPLKQIVWLAPAGREEGGGGKGGGEEGEGGGEGGQK